LEYQSVGKLVLLKGGIVNPMKRVSNLFEKLITDENLETAIDEVNKSHHWRKHHVPNSCTLWVERTKKERIIELRRIICEGFVQKPPRVSRRYDASAQKYRTICEPVQYPDQYIHHALIQVLQPKMLQGMDYYCCGSIRGRGPKRAQKAIETWVRRNKADTRYELCGDIYHFYDSLKPEVVINRIKEIVKDHRIIDLVWRIVKDGVLIGSFTSQWFANTVLQPLDRLIRESKYCCHYVRYMDNLTIFGRNKRQLRKLYRQINNWLEEHQLRLKDDYQIFYIAPSEDKIPLDPPRNGVSRPKHRMPCAVGYRYGRSFTLLRKHNLLRIKRAVARYRRKVRNGSYLSARLASSVISRLGQLAHCNNCNIYKRLFNGERVLRSLKNILRLRAKKAGYTETWNEFIKRNVVIEREVKP
jgi:hypothetical protein